MELITFVIVSALSIGLSLAGSRVMLGALFSLMERSAVRNAALTAPRNLASASD